MGVWKGLGNLEIGWMSFEDVLIFSFRMMIIWIILITKPLR